MPRTSVGADEASSLVCCGAEKQTSDEAKVHPKSEKRRIKGAKKRIFLSYIQRITASYQGKIVILINFE